MTLMEWAIRWRVTPQAYKELRAVMGVQDSEYPALTRYAEGSEALVQSCVRLEAPHKGVRLWRNNVGVLTNEKTGQPVRYGLANDSKQLNEKLKSGDLIGWRSVVITSEMVGTRFAQFVSRECKRPDWGYTGTEHEIAQLRWAEMIVADGGDAKFVTGEGSL